MRKATAHDELAFPVVTGIESLADGMSLWDYFAAHALAGIAASDPKLDAPHTAAWAADCADAMVVERAKRSESLLHSSEGKS